MFEMSPSLAIRRVCSAVVAIALIALAAVTAHASGVRPAGPLPELGEGVTVTAAAEGRLLVYGGGARTWNPGRRTWVPDLQAGNLTRSFHHSATLTAGGRVVTVGGLDVPFANGIQQPALAATASWRSGSGRWENGPGLLSPRLWHAAVALPPDDVLVIGGVAAATADKPFGALLSSVELLGENASVQKAPLRTARIRHSATRLTDGRVLVAGGTNDASEPLASVEIYDPRADRWNAGAPLATARTRHAATLLADGRVLVSGGRDAQGRALKSAEIYDPTRDTWSRGPDLLEARWDHEGVRLADGTVLVAGGWTLEERPPSCLETWSPMDRAFRPAGQLPRTLRDSRVVPLPDGTVLLFGQDPYDGAFVLAWRRDFTDDAPPPVMDDTAFAALPDGRFVVAGGTRRQAPSPLVNIFDPRTGSWSTLPPLPRARTDARAIALPDGRIVVLGGDVAGDDSSARTPVADRPTHPAQVWDPSREQWTASATLALTDGAWAEPLLLPDGRVQLLGIDSTGRGELLSAYRIWDPRDDSIAGPVQVRRPRFGGVALRHPDGGLILLGGDARDGESDDSRRADRWDPVESRWRTLTPASLSLEGARFIALDDGGALAVWQVPGPDGAQRPLLRLMPDGSWRTLPPPPDTSLGSALQARGLKDGALLVVVDGLRSWVREAGGDAWLPMLHEGKWTETLAIVATPDGGALAFRAAAERGYGMATLGVVRLDRQRGRWEPLSPGWQSRPHPALLELGDGEVLAAGGQSAIVQVYQPAGDTWRYEAFLPEPLERPVALRMADGQILLAGTTMGEAQAVLCLSWMPGAREWTSCGRFALAPGEPRRPTALRALDAERTLLVYGDSRAVIRDRSGKWSASRMQLPESPVPPDAEDTGTPFAVALASVWDRQKNTWADATDAWLVNATKVTAVRGTGPAEPWILESGKWRRWDAATRTLTGTRLENPPADGNLGAAVRIGAQCAVAWNDSKEPRDIDFAFRGGATARTIQAVDLTTAKWQAAPPVLSAWQASGLALADGTLLLAGVGVDDERPGTGAVRFRATCAGVLPISTQRVLWLPSVAATPATAARDTTMPPPKPHATLLERVSGALMAMVAEFREHPQRTALPGLLLVLLLYRRLRQSSLYANDDVARTWRVVDAAVALAGPGLALVMLAIPHEAGRLAAVAACLLSSAAATYRLWCNASHPAAKGGLALALAVATSLAVAASGLALIHLFGTMIRNLTA
jgi:hypothetical protein